jgi:hypothetical protein
VRVERGRLPSVAAAALDLTKVGDPDDVFGFGLDALPRPLDREAQARQASSHSSATGRKPAG